MKNFLIILISLFSTHTAIAQFEHKFSFNAYLGVPLFKAAGGIQAENIYYGYKPIPYVCGGINYNLNTKFSIGANLKFLYTTKENYSLTNTNVGLACKYNFVPFDKKVSPFVSFEGNLGYLTISQKANNTVEYPTVDDPQHVVYESQIRSYPQIKTGFACAGAMVGAGLDFTLKLKYGLFFSANYMFTNANKTFTSETNFEENTSKFQFVMIQAGVRFSFGQSKSIY